MGQQWKVSLYRADKSKSFFGVASNVGEMSGMKDARHMILWLFFGLLPMLGSCDFRDMLDDYPVSGVQIKLDWKGVTRVDFATANDH